ncbi:MAG: RHS repeat protein [Deltaproteobacteria bacterium]|nr:RHS repeat protein [Deltaproteobacteria bacterium]MBW2136509.1 RHS repeat protein [Deltaproteobacteria bacterium]
MPRSLLKPLFVLVALAIFVQASLAFPAVPTLFGPQEFTVKRFPLLFSMERFRVEEPGEATLSLTLNSSLRKLRAGFIVLNREFIRLRRLFSQQGQVVEREVRLRAKNRLWVLMVGRPGASITVEIRKKGVILPPQVTFGAEPSALLPGEASTLSWSAKNADSCLIEPGIGPVEPTGSRIVSPSESTDYTLRATGPGGTAEASLRVAVISAPGDLEMGGAGKEGYRGSDTVGEGINLVSGNVTEKREDLRFPSPFGEGLVFEATYNSQSEREGGMGYGWSHTYGVSLDPAFLIEGREFLRIVDERGKSHYFIEADPPASYEGVFHEKTHVRQEAIDYVWDRLDGTRYGFSGSGRLLWVEDPRGNRQELGYTEEGRVSVVKDLASERELSFSYNGQGLIERVLGPGGKGVSYGYDPERNLVSVTYEDGSGFDYSYSDFYDPHNLTEKRDKLSHVLSTWEYDADERVLKSFHPMGKGVEISYMGDTEAEVTDAYGVGRNYFIGDIGGRRTILSMEGGSLPFAYREESAIRWSYDTNLNLIEEESASGAITRYGEYDSRGNPGSVILAWGTSLERVVSYTYHPEMNVPLSRTEASVLGEGQKVTIWDYDRDGNDIPNEAPSRLLSRIVEKGSTGDSAGGVVPYEYVTRFSYNLKGQVISIDGPLEGPGDTILFSYDDVTGDLLSITQPLVGSTLFSAYDPEGRVGEVKDVNAQSRSFTYDHLGRVTSISYTADGKSTEVSYDLSGKPLSLTDEDGVTRNFSYDPEYGRLARITDMVGNYIAYAYDAHGNRKEMGKYGKDGTRAYVKTWDYSHPDYPGKLSKEFHANGSFTEYAYDRAGNLTTIIDPEGNSTDYEYDILGRLVKVTEPLGAITRYSYDTHGNLASITDAEGHETTYVYDDMGRILEELSPDRGRISYSYDSTGNLILRTDARGITARYDYDVLNRLTAIHYPDSSEDVYFSYDEGDYAKGKRTAITDESGTTTFTYDSRGRLTGKLSTILGKSCPFSRLFSPGGRVMEVEYPSKKILQYSRDSMGRMQGLTMIKDTLTVPLVAGMTYNPFGGPKGLSTGYGGEVNNSQGECGCLEVANPGQQMERIYSYDNNRNLISITAPNTPWYSQSFTYDALQRLTQAQGWYGSLSYAYDRVGNRLSKKVNTREEVCSYEDGSNRLKEITGTDGTLTFLYDAAGNTTVIGDKRLSYNERGRLEKVLDEQDNILGEYLYNALGQRVVKKAGGETTLFIYDLDGNLVAEAQEDGIITSEYLYMGKIRVAKVDLLADTLYYYLNDRLGVPQLMVDEWGEIVWSAMYMPFGEAKVHPNFLVENNFRLPGQYYDSETGFQYNYHRYYNPKTGRYITPDPIGLEGGINLFSYVRNSPSNFSDPIGLFGLFGPGLRNINTNDVPLRRPQYKTPFDFNPRRKGIPGQFGLGALGAIITSEPARRTGYFAFELLYQIYGPQLPPIMLTPETLDPLANPYSAADPETRLQRMNCE